MTKSKVGGFGSRPFLFPWKTKKNINYDELKEWLDHRAIMFFYFGKKLEVVNIIIKNNLYRKEVSKWKLIRKATKEDFKNYPIYTG